MSLDTKRHDQLFDKQAFTYPVHLIGAGGVGSHVARQLAMLGIGEACDIHLYDGDVVKPHNLSNQAYHTEHLGMTKVTALTMQYERWSNGIRPFPSEAYVEAVPLAGVALMCLDSMEARKRICDSSVWENERLELLIETRMDASHAYAFAVDPNNDRHRKWWESYWFPDDKAENAGGCNGPQVIIPTIEMTASLAVTLLLGWYRNGFERMPNRVMLDTRNWRLVTERFD